MAIKRIEKYGVINYEVTCDDCGEMLSTEDRHHYDVLGDIDRAKYIMKKAGWIIFNGKVSCNSCCLPIEKAKTILDISNYTEKEVRITYYNFKSILIALVGNTFCIGKIKLYNITVCDIPKEAVVMEYIKGKAYFFGIKVKEYFIVRCNFITEIKKEE